MTIFDTHRHELESGDRAPASQVAEALGRFGEGTFEFVDAKGKLLRVKVPQVVAEVFRQVAGMLAEKGVATVVDEDQEVSPEKAAELLGMSRPTIVHRINQGDLPGRMVGAHHRIRMSDLLAFRAREREREEALAEFGEQTDELTMRHGF